MIKNLPANAGDAADSGSIPGLGWSLGGRNDNPLLYSCLENPMDSRAWLSIVNGVMKSQKWLSYRTPTHFRSWCYPQMAPHSSTFAWKIPWVEEPGRLQSMGSRRVGHDWATSLSLFTFLHWRKTWQPTPVFLPGESQGRGSLVGCRLWGRRESETTEAT